jgi:hypothetical protein
MARAAAKRKPTPKPPAKQPKPSRGVRKANRPVEETLFFHRIRRGTKWVFALLAVAFAFSFVVAGVGSGSTGVGSVFDALGGIFNSGSGGGTSVSKALKRTQKNSKDAAAWLDLARAYQAKGEDISAIGAYETYVKLRPKDTSGLAALAGLYENQLQAYSQAAQSVAPQQTESTPSFGPSGSSPLGQALEDPIQKAASGAATDTQQSQAYQQFAALAQRASTNVEKTYKRLAAADPTEPSYLIRYAQLAGANGDTKQAVASYKTFLKKFPEDPNARYAKTQLKALQAGSGSPSSG